MQDAMKTDWTEVYRASRYAFAREGFWRVFALDGSGPPMTDLRKVPLPDGTRLAAKVWLPEDTERNPVPAVLEYIPYRKRDRHADPIGVVM